MTSKSLTKTNKTDKVVCGVIGGLSKNIGIKPFIPRLAFLFLLFSSFGFALLIYTIFALTMLEEEENI